MTALRLVRAEGLEARGARQLSGGQQQRVALARAIVNRPAALLLDEPLSALDVKLRQQMQMELKQIQLQLGTTFVYVTHDQEEALLLSDRDRHHGRRPPAAGRHALASCTSDPRPRSWRISWARSMSSAVTVVDVRHGIAVVVPTGTATRTRLPRGPHPGRGARRRTDGIGRPGRHPSGTHPAACPSRRAARRWRPWMPTDTCLPGRVERLIYLGNLTRVVTITATGQPITSEHISDEHLAGVTEGSEVLITWPLAAGFILPERS